LGAEAKLSDAILPVALFTSHLPAKQYFTISNIFSYLGYGEGGGDLVGFLNYLEFLRMDKLLARQMGLNL
jgi:hypothetical protein